MAEESTKPLTEKHILAIDDEKNCILAMELYLQNNHYKVTTALGGLAGLEAAQNIAGIDLILLDLMMPDLYGLDLLSSLKANDNLKHIPVILQTGSADMNELEKGLKLGAVAILAKPYTKKDLIKAVEKVLGTNS